MVPAEIVSRALSEVIRLDLVPILAHPERYSYFAANKTVFDEFKSMGCLFQLNMLALVGHYGKSVQELAHYLGKKEYYDLVGSDLHNYRHLDALHNPALGPALKKILATGKIRNQEL